VIRLLLLLCALRASASRPIEHVSQGVREGVLGAVELGEVAPGRGQVAVAQAGLHLAILGTRLAHAVGERGPAPRFMSRAALIENV